MVEGTVKWFDKKKGYGFIACEGEPDVFVHYTGFGQADLRTLDDGDRVRFEMTAGEKGPRARDVVLVDASRTDSAD
ncbi:MAG TPA: cold-shock protein [Phycisphaerales bacterium]|nr:cold-shock protein [Phycisphaerales bacterium]